MKRLFVTAGITLALIFAACTSQKESVSTFGINATDARTFSPDTIDVLGVDSLMKADDLPDIGRWASSTFVDDETHRAFIYRTLYDRTSGIIYTLKTLQDGRFVLIKRSVSGI